MKELSVIIPTLLKDPNLLCRLLESFVQDKSVSEVIIINNSTESFNYENKKVKIISKGKNLYVNPSWNLGVKEASSEYIALVNDDIIIPDNFCSAVLDKINNDSGIIGMDNDFIINLRDENNNIKEIPQTSPMLSEKITLKPVTYRTTGFGIIMFFKKDVYQPIPEDLKIFFGDDYIVHCARKQKKICAVICGQNIIHCGSLSSNAFSDLAKNENKLYKKYVFPWYKKLLYFYQRDTHYSFYFLFMNFSIRKK